MLLSSHWQSLHLDSFVRVSETVPTIVRKLSASELPLSSEIEAMSFDSLKGKVIAVSGGRSGIGLAIAKKLLHHGAKVAIADISPNPPEELASIAEIDTDYIYTQADVSRRETVRQWVKLIGNKFGRLDGMIPNAGIAPDESRIEDNDTFEHVMAVNVLGVWNCGIESFLQFQDQGSGGVICITSSTQGLRGGKAIPAYTASKHAIIGLMRAWALDWADRGIRVNAVAPGKS